MISVFDMQQFDLIKWLCFLFLCQGEVGNYPLDTPLHFALPEILLFRVLTENYIRAYKTSWKRGTAKMEFPVSKISKVVLRFKLIKIGSNWLGKD